jgi:hypothetical protein
VIDGIKVDREPHAFFDKLKLNHAAAREKVWQITDSERGLVRNALQQLFGVFALCGVDEENGAAVLVLST